MDDCIISQKSQVFNFGVESMILEADESMDAHFSMLDDKSPQKRSAPPQSMNQSLSSTNLKNCSFESNIRSTRTEDDDFFDTVRTMYDDELFRQETEIIIMNLSNNDSIDNLLATCDALYMA